MDCMREVIWLYQSPAFIKDDLCLENVLLFVVLHTVSLNIGDSQVFSKYQGDFGPPSDIAPGKGDQSNLSAVI